MRERKKQRGKTMVRKFRDKTQTAGASVIRDHDLHYFFPCVHKT